MSSFEFISVALSIVIGLGLTQLLKSAVVVLRAWGEHGVDVLPILWAMIVFVTIVQFWWALFELDAGNLVTEWSLAGFMLLLAGTVLLYVAAALVLPGVPSDLRGYFDGDGRWALGMLAAYNVFGVWANVSVFGAGLFEPLQLMMYGVTGVLCVVIVTRNRQMRVALTLAYAAFLVWGLFYAAPTTYPA